MKLLDITPQIFQIIGNYITSNKNDIFTNHDTFHLLLQVHKYTIQQVLIDRKDGLKIYTLEVKIDFGYLESSVDINRRIKIIECDEEEISSKGVDLIFPIRVGPIVKNITF